MRKLSAKLVPKCLNADQKCGRVLASLDILDQFWQDPIGFLSRLISMDETGVNTYDPETKNNPRNGDKVVPHVQRSSRQKSSSKLLVPVFWN
jgi:hypothetical protein